MVSGCCVNGCGKESYPGCGLSFHKFPKDKLMHEKWLEVIPGNITKSSVVCNRHFKKQDFNPFTSKKKLNLDAVPSIFPVLQPKSKLPVPTICISQGPGPERCIEISPLTSELPEHKKKPVQVPTILISKGPERCIEISPLSTELPQQPSKRMQVPMIVRSVSSETKDPLFLENEPMDEIEHNTEHSYCLPIKSENEEEEDEESNHSSSSFEAEYLEEDTPPSSPTPKPTNYLRNQLSAPKPTNYMQNQLPAPTPTTSMQNQLPAPTPANYQQNQLPAPTPTNYQQNQLPAPTPNNYMYNRTLRTLQISQKRRADLKRKVKALQQKLHRKQVKEAKFAKIIHSVKEYTKFSEIENILNGNFKELCAAVHNNGVTVNYSDKVIRFALTVYNYSPEAYEFIRTYMSLPHTRMLQKYAATDALNNGD